MTTTTVKTLQGLTAIAGEKEPCPGCGNLKFKTIEAQGKTIRLLTCAPCSGKFQEYKARAVEAMAKDPAAPEPKSKFEWLLDRIDLVQLKREEEGAIGAYRKAYGEKIISALRQRGYLDDEPRWVPGPWKRPDMRFTTASHRSGFAVALRDELERGIESLYGQMKRAAGHLEAATRVKAELEAKKATTEAPTPAPAAT